MTTKVVYVQLKAIQNDIFMHDRSKHPKYTQGFVNQDKQESRPKQRAL